MNGRMVVVGAGIAGLSTGYFARLNGFDTTILESAAGPGGLCAAWTRKGYTFDMSMHMVTNSLCGPFRKIWEELGVVGDREFHYHEAMGTIESGDKRLDMWTDRDKLMEALLALSPEDAALSEEFVNLFCGPSVMGAATLKPNEFLGPLDYLRMVGRVRPVVRLFRKYGRTTVQEFASRFHDPFLRNAIRFTIDTPGWPMPRVSLAILAGFAASAVTEAGVPIGGSNKAMQDLAERYERAGGVVRYRSRVVDVIVENDRARGVRLEDENTVPADIVVWAGDGHHLIYDILGGRYQSDAIRTMYRDWIPVQPLVQVLLGVNRDMSSEPFRLVRELAKPIDVGGELRRWIYLVSHAFDPTSAPAGKAAIEVWYPANYENWEKLAADRKQYKREKERIADLSITALEERFPGIRDQVEVIDVTTPATYVRYTGNWKGSPDGWYSTVDNLMNRSMQRSLPGLAALYTVGQWTAPFTGTIMAAVSGRQLIEILCRKAHQPFVTCAKGTHPAA